MITENQDLADWQYWEQLHNIFEDVKQRIIFKNPDITWKVSADPLNTVTIKVHKLLSRNVLDFLLRRSNQTLRLSEDI